MTAATTGATAAGSVAAARASRRAAGSASMILLWSSRSFSATVMQSAAAAAVQGYPGVPAAVFRVPSARTGSCAAATARSTSSAALACRARSHVRASMHDMASRRRLRSAAAASRKASSLASPQPHRPAGSVAAPVAAAASVRQVRDVVHLHRSDAGGTLRQPAGARCPCWPGAARGARSPGATGRPPRRRPGGIPGSGVPSWQGWDHRRGHRRGCRAVRDHRGQASRRRSRTAPGGRTPSGRRSCPGRAGAWRSTPLR